MSYTDFYKNWHLSLNKLYPSTILLEEKEFNQSVSPFQIKIPQQAIQKMTDTIHYIFHWGHQQKTNQPLSQIPISNYSVLMAYDFHLDSNNQPKLIEINTNGAGFLIIDLLDKIHNKQTSALLSLKDSFFNEWKLFSNNKHSTPYTVILDENIEKQPLKFEFFMYQDLIKSWGWDCEILDASQLKLDSKGYLKTPSNKSINFIYNRLTDFYLEKYPIINQAYQKQKVCLSPHPKEYHLLADKKNLQKLSSLMLEKNQSHHLQKPLPDTILKTEFISDHLWTDRKNLFFKPFRGYGGKKAYRGMSITKTKFKEIQPGIAQEYIPPSTWTDTQTNTTWKVDIRIYAYKDKVQLIGARVYQGQITNFKTPLGGFCSTLT